MRGLRKAVVNATQTAADRLVAPFHDFTSDILIIGFWRSGTTWIQQMMASIIQAKTVFEPIHPSVRRAQRLYNELGLSSLGIQYQELYMPFASETLGKPLYNFFKDTLTSHPGGAWIRRARMGWREHFRTRVVLKLVRGHLCALPLSRDFHLPVIHVRRDPRAIVASLNRKANWSFWHDIRLPDLLLEPKDGRAQVFEQWREEIECAQAGDRITRLITYWALTEKYLVDSFQAAGEHLYSVQYEDLLLEGERLMIDLAAKLSDVEEGRLGCPRRFDSPTTHRERQGSTDQERVVGWKRELSPEIAIKTESIVQRFDLTDRLLEPSSWRW